MWSPRCATTGAFILVAFLSLSTTCLAAFDSNRIEHLSGTAFDSTTWESYPSPPPPLIFAQNDGITIKSYYSADNAADYTTRSVAVGVGEGIRVAFTIHPTPGTSTTNTWIWLTTNSK